LTRDVSVISTNSSRYQYAYNDNNAAHYFRALPKFLAKRTFFTTKQPNSITPTPPPIHNDTISRYPKDQLFLHVAPCGDFWTGHEIFAAKHLQPGDVKSIPISNSLDIEEWLESHDEKTLQTITQEIYDSGIIPPIK